MRFSVIVPSRNGANRIHHALTSIRQQTFSDYELIVVCDSCSDSTADVAKTFGAQILEVDVKSAGLAKNEALKVAQGDYLLFCNDDDSFVHAQAFEIVDVWLEKLECDVLCFGFIMGKLGYRHPLSNNGNFFPGETLKAWRRSFVGETKFIADQITHDSHFMSDIFNKKPNIGILDAPIYYHDWMREGSLTWQRAKGLI